jgi:hypothetical protein
MATTIEQDILQYFREMSKQVMSTEKIMNEINLRHNYKLDLDKYYNLLTELKNEGNIRTVSMDGTGKTRGTELWSYCRG